jgi:putative transposase
MIIRKSFQYQLQPTKKQARALQVQLDECRWLYNELLEQRKLSYEELDIHLTKYQQLMLLPELKIEKPALESIHSQVLQNVVDRLDKAYQAFFRRCKNGEKPGFPRFRGVHRYNSFCYPQSGFAIIGKELKLSKIGSIPIKMHRQIQGEIKTCTIRRNSSGSWFVSISCELEAKPLPANENAVGIDMGIENFAVLSSGQQISNPRFFKSEQKNLAKAQRKLSKAEKGTVERGKRGKIVAKVHERISNKRKDFCHKESRKIVNQYQYICIEELNIKKMIEGSHYAKSITDVSWNQFGQFLTYKAEEAGRKLGAVNPAYTSQKCSRCHHLQVKLLSEREHFCSQCGYKATRDFNAAQNILALGLDGLGEIPRSLRL